MEISFAQKSWDEYRVRELGAAAPLLEKLGYELDETQVHTVGERYLMAGERDVGGGGYKLVLLGIRKRDGKRVVIKISSEQYGIREIETERKARETVQALKFAYRTLYIPEELLFTHHGPFCLFITAYIDQDQTFLQRPITEQFHLALAALKAQEGVHATTGSHARVIRSVFGMWGKKEYLDSFGTFTHSVLGNDPENQRLKSTLGSATAFLTEHQDTIEQYSDFLTHADFVPHNLRVENGTVYLLDSASLHFGNKYESWARFLNFMLLYNRPLEEALVEYVRINRTPEESLSLRLMRVYKLGKLLEYHASTLPKTEGDMHALSTERIEFWRTVLDSFLADTTLGEEVISTYKQSRDRLRSGDEKKRQEALH